MPGQVNIEEERIALSNAAHITSSLCRMLADLNIPISQHPLPNNVESLIPKLTLSVPDDILAPLATLDIPERLRQLISQRLDRFIGDLEEQYNSTYRHAVLETLRTMNSIDDIGAVHRAYQALTERQCLPLIQGHVAQIQTQVAKYQAHQTPASESKHQFNHDFTPILEVYFEYNGFPSIGHRSILAQKSRMTPRQIEVWFQNHRNRARKEGRFVRRLNSDVPLKRAFDLLEQNALTRQNRLPTPPQEEKLTITAPMPAPSPAKPISSQQLILEPPTLLDDFYRSRPPHAYPSTRNSKYPDPFPNDEGVSRFPSPAWRRKPATVTIVSTAVDMDEFARTFHLKLNFSENPRRRGTTPSKRESPSFQPWFAATTTFALPAPHSALIRTPPRPTSPISTPSLTQFTFKPTFGSSSLPASTASLPAPPGEAPARKTRPLPRRTPPRSRPNPFGSRTSSFSSDTSSGSRMSSYSSDYSSPEPLTPPTLPNSDLPVVHDDGQQQELFDFSLSYEPGTNNHFADFLPSQTSEFSNTYPDSNKLPDLSVFEIPFPELWT